MKVFVYKNETNWDNDYDVHIEIYANRENALKKLAQSREYAKQQWDNIPYYVTEDSETCFEMMGDEDEYGVIWLQLEVTEEEVL